MKGKQSTKRKKDMKVSEVIGIGQVRMVVAQDFSFVISVRDFNILLHEAEGSKRNGRLHDELAASKQAATFKFFRSTHEEQKKENNEKDPQPTFFNSKRARIFKKKGRRYQLET